MANKYIIHGATFNGDGTSSAEATSNGGVGAWNTITYFEGTAPAYGKLAAGDVVYIRSKDAGGANISLAKSGATLNLGSASATESSPITWIFDSGDVWSGVDGNVAYTMSTANLISTRNYNNIYCKQGKLALVNSLATHGNPNAISLGAATIKGVSIDLSAHTTTGASTALNSGTYIDILWSVAYSYSGIIVLDTPTVDAVLVNPKISTLLAGGNLANMGPVFNATTNYGGSFTVFGGEVTGDGMIDGRVIVGSSGNTGSINIYGFKYPSNIPLSSTSKLTNKAKLFATGCDGALGTAYWDFYYAFDSRSDGYYPTLNALLENSTNTGWSFKVYPHTTTKQKPALITTSKMYTQNAAVKTVTLDLLWPNTMSAPTKDAVFITVVYTDNATGNKVTQNTYAPLGGTLDASTAAWSTTTYGPVSFDKYKLQITTNTAVKKDTEIMVVLSSSPKSANSSRVIFVDPDVALS